MAKDKVPLQHKFEDAGVMMWRCGCGDTRFYLRSDGKAECNGCGKFPPYTVKFNGLPAQAK